MEETGKLAAIMLLARPLKAASPDAKHPGKAEKNPQGKASFPLGFSPDFPRMQSIRAGRFSGRARSITAASLAVLSK